MSTLSTSTLATNNFATNNFGDNQPGGMAGPLALLIIVLLALATWFLIRNMNTRLRRLPREFPLGESTPGDGAAIVDAGRPGAGKADAGRPDAGKPDAGGSQDVDATP